VEELKLLNPDILIMQEIDHYEDFYKPSLENLKYEPHFLKRKLNTDGVLVAYKTDKFNMEKVDFIDYDTGHQFENDPEFHRGQGAVILKLTEKGTKK